MRDRLIEIFRKTNYQNRPNGLTANLATQFSEYALGEVVDALLANGVIVLPCKVGDMVYQLKENCICTIGHRYLHNTCNRPTSCQDCPHVEIKRWIVETTFSLCMLDRIGQDFFVTKEQAEKALAEVANEQRNN